MKLYEITHNIEIQCDYLIVYYDQEKRIIVSEDIYEGNDVNYIYIENGVLIIEIDYYN